jgi:hypothetical protein
MHGAMKTKTLIKVQHGSHLYGLARPDSDLDTYEVYDFFNHRYRPRRQARQEIDQDSNTDSTRVSLERFESFCLNGVPQAIETLFAPVEAIIEVHPDWWEEAGRIQASLDRNKVLDTFRRTCVNFMKEDDAKKNRHAYRIVINARAFKATGSFNPRLNEWDAGFISGIARLPYQERLRYWYDFCEVFDDVVP